MGAKAPKIHGEDLTRLWGIKKKKRQRQKHQKGDPPQGQERGQTEGTDITLDFVEPWGPDGGVWISF